MNKNFIKIVKVCFLIIIVLIVLILMIDCVVYLKNKSVDTKADQEGAPYLNIDYRIPNDPYCSCISFGKDRFSEYDCDSETTNMPFSGEFYDKYTYNKDKQIIVFKGDMHIPIEAKVLKWTKDVFKIQVLGVVKNDVECSSNGRDIYTYYREK